jgi:hypothetical protein
MRVLVIGAGGVIGTRLVPQLRERGHEVIGSSRSPGKAARLRALGAEPIVLDALDARAVREAVAAVRPDAIVYQATALSDLSDLKHFDRSFAQTNRLRTEGTDIVLAAARKVGVRRPVFQSYANHRYARVGGPVKAEDDPLDPAPAAAMRRSVAAMNHLERAVTEAGGIALRYGNFYGEPDDALVAAVRAQVPDRGERRGRLVAHPPGRRRRRHRPRPGARRPGRLQRRRRRARARRRVAARAGEGRRRQATPAPPALDGTAPRRRRGRRHDHRVARCGQRQGQARAGLDPPLPELAPGLRRGLRPAGDPPRRLTPGAARPTPPAAETGGPRGATPPGRMATARRASEPPLGSTGISGDPGAPPPPPAGRGPDRAARRTGRRGGAAPDAVP